MWVDEAEAELAGGHYPHLRVGLPVVQGHGGEVVESPVEVGLHVPLDRHKSSEESQRRPLQEEV